MVLGREGEGEATQCLVNQERPLETTFVISDAPCLGCPGNVKTCRASGAGARSSAPEIFIYLRVT